MIATIETAGDFLLKSRSRTKQTINVEIIEISGKKLLKLFIICCCNIVIVY